MYVTREHLFSEVGDGAPVFRVVEQNRVLRVDVECSEFAFGTKKVLTQKYRQTIIMMHLNREKVLQH